MGIKSSIEWTELTWNPVTGCIKISEGCAHCYAERTARRLKAMGQKNIFKSFWNQRPLLLASSQNGVPQQGFVGV